MRFQTRLWLILLPGTLGVLLFGVISIWGANETVGSLQTLRRDADVARQAGTLAHQLQIERGLSAGFLGGKSAELPEPLVAARARVDAAMGDRRLPLKELRERIERRALEPKESFSTYTELIGHLLAEQTKLASSAADPRASRLANALDLVSLAKEQAGRERALINASLATGKLNAEAVGRVHRVVSAQDQLLTRFETFADAALLEQYRLVKQTPEVTGATALRDSVLALGADTAQTIPSAEWFAAQTAKLEQYRKLELTAAISLDTALDASLSRAKWQRLISLLAVVLVLGATLTIGRVQSRVVLNTLGGEPELVRQVMKHLAAGELNVPIEVKAGDTQSLLYEAQQTQLELAQVIRRIRSTSKTVSSSVNEIASASEDLAQRTAKEAANVEQASATLQEAARAASSNAHVVVEVRDLSARAAQAAERSGDSVSQLGQTVATLQTVFGEVATLVSTIDEVAFQTRLLALNAAVEAGRAGDAGRGFAVVAGEVQSLAGRTDQLARQVGQRMRDAGELVRNGVEAAEQVNRALHTSVQEAQEVDRLLQQVSSNSSDQSTKLELLNDSLHRVDEGTQRNAAVAEQSTAAAMSMRKTAETLDEEVGRFVLEGRRAA